MALPALTIFDIETTGLDPKKGHRLIEIAGIRMENGIILRDRTFTSFVNPERDIPWEARQVNKITDEMVKNAPTIEEVLPQFLEFAAGTTLIAHNASFDYGFLQNEKQYCWGYVDLPPCLCTMRLSQSLFPREFRHSLDVLIRKFNLPTPANRHRALDDAIIAAEALLKLVEQGNVTSSDEFRRRASLQSLASVQ